MEKTLDLKMPGVMKLGMEELQEVDGGGWMANLVGAVIAICEINGNYYYGSGNYVYSPFR